MRKCEERMPCAQRYFAVRKEAVAEKARALIERIDVYAKKNPQTPSKAMMETHAAILRQLLLLGIPRAESKEDFEGILKTIGFAEGDITRGTGGQFAKFEPEHEGIGK